METTRLGVADDHNVFRETLVNFINKSDENFTVLAEGACGMELLANMATQEIDIALLDYAMPNLNGYETAKIIKEKYPNTKIVILSLYKEKQKIVPLIELGIQGYLCKKCTIKELMFALKTVVEKGYYFDDTVTSIMSEDELLVKTNSPEVKFSPREMEIIKLICEQSTNKEIAQLLNVSKRTIDGHRERIFAKMQVKNVVGLVVYAYENKLVAEKKSEKTSAS